MGKPKDTKPVGDWYDLVRVPEGKRWTERFEESKRIRDEQERKVNAQKDALNKEKQKKVVKKIGKK